MAQAEDPHFASVSPTGPSARRGITSVLTSIRLLAVGRGAPDAVADSMVSAVSPGFPAPLRAMRIAVLLFPTAAALLVAISLIDQSFFSFSRGDRTWLAVLVALGSAAALAVYQRPRITAQAFVSLWTLRPFALAIFAIVLLIPAGVFDSVFLGRLFLGIILIPVVAATWAMYHHLKDANLLARAFPLIFMVMAAVPGFILPPYYQGIAGWTDSVKVGETITLYGHQLVNDRGERIWVTHTLFSPVTQWGRFNVAWAAKRDKIGPIEPFILKAYTRSYPLLVRGYMPHQRYLGRWAYPPSTYATNLPDHREFPPERITHVQYVGLTYDRSDKLIDMKIYEDYRVPR